MTLWPVPGFAKCLARERANDGSPFLTADDRARLAALDLPAWWENKDTEDTVREPLLRAAASYFLAARTPRGVPVDPVARFHLGNGARLEQLDWLADTSPKGLEQSHGLMVNYLYDLDDIEKNHESYAASRTIVASNAVRRLARGAVVQLMPAVAG